MHSEHPPASTPESPPTALIACPECDLLLQPVPLTQPRSRAQCPRCGARLYSFYNDRLEKLLALSCAAVIMLLTAYAFPIVGLNIQGTYIETTVFGAIDKLWQEEREVLSGLVFVTTVIMPSVELGAILWLVIPLWRGVRPPGFAPVFRAFQMAHPWAMVEVFILGVLVSLVKLSHLADVLPGPAIWCFGCLMLLLAGLASLLDPYTLWHAWEDARATPAKATAP